MTDALLAVTFDLDARGRAVLVEAVGDATDIVWLAPLAPAARAQALARAGAILARHTGELLPGEPPLIANAKLLQMMTAGVDYIPLRHLPPGLAVASNRGAFAEPMAEHAVALALAAAKRLPVEHRHLAEGASTSSRRTACSRAASPASSAWAASAPPWRGAFARSACAFMR